jgi:hypothetical protein
MHKKTFFIKKIADFHQTKTQHSLEKIQPGFLATSFLFLKRFLNKSFADLEKIT